MHQSLLSIQVFRSVVKRVFLFQVELRLHRPHVLPSVAVEKVGVVHTPATLSGPWLVAVDSPLIKQLVIVVAMLFACFHLLPDFVLRNGVISDKHFLWLETSKLLNTFINVTTDKISIASM